MYVSEYSIIPDSHKGGIIMFRLVVAIRSGVISLMRSNFPHILDSQDIQHILLYILLY